MATILTEGTGSRQLTFKFSDKWQVYKYDEPIAENFYTKLRGLSLKAVDFVAISDKSVLFIEVKCIFADNENSSLRFLPTDDNDIVEKVTEKLTANEKQHVFVSSKRPYLAKEIVKKMRDTLTGLLAAYRNADRKLAPINKMIFVDNKPIFFIFFLERKGELNLAENFKPMASNLKLAIEQKLDFLGNVKVDVVNTKTLPISLGIEVSVGSAGEGDV